VYSRVLQLQKSTELKRLQRMHNAEAKSLWQCWADNLATGLTNLLALTSWKTRQTYRMRTAGMSDWVGSFLTTHQHNIR